MIALHQHLSATSSVIAKIYRIASDRLQTAIFHYKTTRTKMQCTVNKEICTRCQAPQFRLHSLTSCQTCSVITHLCHKCRVNCRCGFTTCLECFTRSHVNTCYNKRHPSTQWNPIILWECSCHELPHATSHHQQMTCELCKTTKLCQKGAADCDCDLTLCTSCMLDHSCPFEKDFETNFLNYKVTFHNNPKGDA
jgi:hypothetical protein